MVYMGSLSQAVLTLFMSKGVFSMGEKSKREVQACQGGLFRRSSFESPENLLFRIPAFAIESGSEEHAS